MSDPRFDPTVALASDGGGLSADGWYAALADRPPVPPPCAAVEPAVAIDVEASPAIAEAEPSALTEAQAAAILDELTAAAAARVEAAPEAGPAVGRDDPVRAGANGEVGQGSRASADAKSDAAVESLGAETGDPALAGDGDGDGDGEGSPVAEWPPDDAVDVRPAVPPDFVGYCLGCRYDLRGLTEPRCPECGRAFRPTDPTSYSPMPGGGAGKPKARPTPRRTSAPAAFPWSPGTTHDRVAWLERRVRQLSLRNNELEGMVRTLIDVLVARGMLTADDLFEIVPAEPAGADPAAEFGPDPGVVAEALNAVTDDTPLSDEPDVETAALRELQRAVRQRRRL